MSEVSPPNARVERRGRHRERHPPGRRDQRRTGCFGKRRLGRDARCGAADDAPENARARFSSRFRRFVFPRRNTTPDLPHALREPQLVTAGCGARDGDARGAQARDALRERGGRLGVEAQRRREGFYFFSERWWLDVFVARVPSKKTRFVVRPRERSFGSARRVPRRRRESCEGRQAGSLRTRRRRRRALS